MNFKINFSVLLVTALFAISCNSSKKNVENGDGKDYSNFNRVGSLDTMQDALVLPGNIKSIDAYVFTANKGLRNDMRESNEGGISKKLILGGKSNGLIRSSVNTTSPSSSNYSFYRKDGALIYAESKEVQSTETIFYKYYYNGDKITDILIGKIVGRDDQSKGTLEWKKADLIPGKEAELKGIETNISTQFLKIPPYKGKVYKNADKFTFTSCYDGIEYSLEDKNGSLGKTFKERGIEPGNYLMFNLNGVKNEDKKLITVGTGDIIPAVSGVSECF